MSKEEIREKAIECAREVENTCLQTKCSECPMYEECVYLTGIKCPTYPVWSYEQGFADGIKEFAENLKKEIYEYLMEHYESHLSYISITRLIGSAIAEYDKEQKK